METQSSGPHDSSGRDAAHGGELETVAEWAKVGWVLARYTAVAFPLANESACRRDVHALGRKRRLKVCMQVRDVAAVADGENELRR
jgi:hypothetical protein